MPTVLPTPEEESAGTAIDDLLADAPNWAAFTISEAHAAIDDNVIDLDSAKAIIKKMASMLVVLRRIVRPEL